MKSYTTSSGVARLQTADDSESESIEESGLVWMLAIFVTCSLMLNALFAIAALDGNHMMKQVAAEQGVSVERMGEKIEHFRAVQKRYGSTARGRLLYNFEFMGGQWAAISIAAAVALSWMWRRRSLRKAFMPLVLNLVLLAIVFVNWPTVSKIANWLN